MAAAKLLEKLHLGRAAPPRPGARRLFDFHPGESVTDVYEVRQLLGRGAFAQVKLGLRRSDGQQVAIKCIARDNVNVKTTALQAEVAILMRLKHPGIVELMDVFEDERTIYLVFELMTGGELYERIRNDYPQGYSVRVAGRIVRRIVEAVAYLHTMGIVHRDLKPENLLLETPESDEEIKLSDFGLAKVYADDVVMRTACGTPNYVAPEVLDGSKEGYGAPVDMWSVGVIAYVLLCGFCPFHEDNVAALFDLITKGDYSFPSPWWDAIPAPPRDFISKLLVVNPAGRLTAAQALAHPWLVEVAAGASAPEAPIPGIAEAWRDRPRAERGQSEVEGAVRAGAGGISAAASRLAGSRG